jgi:hypothetical protein
LGFAIDGKSNGFVKRDELDVLFLLVVDGKLIPAPEIDFLFPSGWAIVDMEKARIIKNKFLMFIKFEQK